MLVQEESLPKANIYSSKILFEQVDVRNKKRMAQMMKRKTALSVKDNLNKSRNGDLSPKTPKKTQKFENNDDLIFINLIRDKENNLNNTIKPNYNQVIIDIKVDSEEKNNDLIESNNNNYKLDKFSPILNNINENNNYCNNSSTNNSNNNSILLRDSQEKEVNISNLDNDSIDEIIINKEDVEINHKRRKSNLFDYDKDDDTLAIKGENKLKEENEYALKYLSSSSDSFVQLDNHLVVKAKAQGGDMTDSYLQALFPQFGFETNKALKNKNYEVTDTIKEEKEIDTPLRLKNNNSLSSKDNANKESKENLDINFDLNENSSLKSDSFIKILKKPINKKSMTNFQIYQKRSKYQLNKNIENNSLNESKNKSKQSYVTTKKMKKNNTMSRIAINKKKLNNNYLNNSSSLSNIKINKCDKNLNNKSNFNSTFSSNLYCNRTKIEYGLNKNKKEKINLKKSLNNIIYNKNESDQDDSLIFDYIKNINKPKNIKNNKINSHYIKNINNYQKYKNCCHINKNIIKKNLNELELNKLNKEKTENNLNTLNHTKRNNLMNDSYSNYYNSIDITKRRNILSSRNISKKLLDNNTLKLGIVNNNRHKEICQKYKDLNINEYNVKVKSRISHYQTPFSSIRTNKNTNNNGPKFSRIKSLSKLQIKESAKNSLNNQDSKIKRSKTHKKLRINDKNNESIILNTSYTKNNKNININNNNGDNKKRKFINIYKKIDYSYVKPKVETGLSETMLKKLLNNGKKLSRIQTNKKIEPVKKQSLMKRCKMTMNKTIEGFKKMASNIKKKLFKEVNKK